MIGVAAAIAARSMRLKVGIAASVAANVLARPEFVTIYQKQIMYYTFRLKSKSGSEKGENELKSN